MCAYFPHFPTSREESHPLSFSSAHLFYAALKNWYFWTVVLEKTLEIKPVPWTARRSNQSILKETSASSANRVLLRKCTGHSKHPLPTTQEKTRHLDITRWSTPKSYWYSLQPNMEKLYTVSKNKTWSWLWLRSWTPYCQIQTQIEESRENH